MMEDEKYLFDKAIQARYEHIHSYNHWMNMYAIFNGALFVCLYTLNGKNTNSILLGLLTLFLGVIAGWCWYFSAKGFYDWLLSYIKNTNKHEKILNIKDEDKVFSIFYGKLENKELKENPYSTQKLTQFFTFCIAVAWTTMFLLKILGFLLEKQEEIKNFIENLVQYDIEKIIIFLMLVGFVFVLIIFIYLLGEKSRENLKKDNFQIFDLNS